MGVVVRVTFYSATRVYPNPLETFSLGLLTASLDLGESLLSSGSFNILNIHKSDLLFWITPGMTEDHELWNALSSELFELVCCGVEQPHRCRKPNREARLIAR